MRGIGESNLRSFGSLELNHKSTMGKSMVIFLTFELDIFFLPRC